NSFSIQQMKTGKDLLNQINSKNWLESPTRPELGKEFLLLCPPEAGLNFIDLVKNSYPQWRMLDEDGWSLRDLPERLKGIGGVVWLILPHREGKDARDGSENAAASVIAGFAEAVGIELSVLIHSEARDLADVGARVLEFGNEKEFLEKLTRAEESLTSSL